MKRILLLLITAQGAFAMEQESLISSKKSCFVAYTKFKAMVQTCKQYDLANDGYHVRPGMKERQECVSGFYQQFIKECTNESLRRFCLRVYYADRQDPNFKEKIESCISSYGE